MQRQDPTSLGKHPIKPHRDGSTRHCCLSIPTVLKTEILGSVFESLLDGATEGSQRGTTRPQEREGLQLHVPATKQSCGGAGH